MTEDACFWALGTQLNVGIIREWHFGTNSSQLLPQSQIMARISSKLSLFERGAYIGGTSWPKDPGPGPWFTFMPFRFATAWAGRPRQSFAPRPEERIKFSRLAIVLAFSTPKAMRPRQRSHKISTLPETWDGVAILGCFSHEELAELQLDDQQTEPFLPPITHYVCLNIKPEIQGRPHHKNRGFFGYYEVS
ncbi:hypothetical protein BCR34DRAFT_97285 [Clohesyomyces aquaticus]|uniref:Uncharacterized protein n=1 Tax=Clohesyomyces aquaticus TaxID=1231657 RepID=A0A1Y2A2F1_9PLEO|nr:hypothetical protein BCR34DRAFT_97285 [Clohesyomyces aquaticus]